ncbi:MAG TPA: hypothetical protein PK360_19820 [bacterium]|nr:hypothetical protein [bacterium]
MNETAGAQTKNQKSEGGRITVVVSILIITFGVGLYLNNHHVIPGVDWFWVLGLTIVGLLILTLGGIDKFSIVAGPYLMCLAGFIFLYQTDRISLDTVIPALIILFGVLVLLSYFLPVRVPYWLIEDKDEEDSAT